MISEVYPNSLNRSIESDVSTCQRSIQDLIKVSREDGLAARKRMRFTIIILLILILVLSFALSILGYLYLIPDEERQCNSIPCIRSASNLLSSMDMSIDPCEDFYKFACAAWPIEHPIPDNAYNIDWFSDRSNRLLQDIQEFLNRENREDEPVPVHQARTFYKSCINIDEQEDNNLEPVVEVLEHVDLPIFPEFGNLSDDASHNFSIVRAMALSKNIFNKDFFVKFGISSDLKNRTINRLYIAKPDGKSPLPAHRNFEKMYRLKMKNIRSELEIFESNETDPDSSDLRAHITYMKSALRAMYLYDHEEPDHETEIIDDHILYQILKFDFEVDEMLETVYAENSTIPKYYTITELQAMTDSVVNESDKQPVMDWKEYLTIMFQDIDNVTLDFENEIILVEDENYIKSILHFLAQSPRDIIMSYMWWIVVSTLAPYSHSHLRRFNQEYLIDTGRIGRNREFYCADAINQIMGLAVSYYLVDSFPLVETRNKVKEMLNDISWAFSQSVEKLDWMDMDTKAATLKKVKAMKAFIGYPEKLLNSPDLEEYYDGVEVDEQSYLENVLHELQRVNKYTLESLREPYDYQSSDNWATDPTDVNAFHWTQANSITIPAGILQFPFYGHDIEALNYGAIGSIVGHEITHGFDSSGKEYDDGGNANPWWTNKTKNEFKEKTQCFINHYSSYYFPEHDKKLDGKHTLDENIADNGGLREALIGYRKFVQRNGIELSLPGLENFTHEQLLFLSFANTWCEHSSIESELLSLRDEHSPNAIRVSAVLTNSEEFARVWKCKKGSQMNPIREKCEIW